MPSYKSTIKNLVVIELDMLKQSRDSAWFKYINKEAVERFYMLNADTLEIFKSIVNTLNANFLAKDKNGEILFAFDDVTGKEQYIFIHDEAKKNYQSEMKTLGEREISIFY